MPMGTDRYQETAMCCLCSWWLPSQVQDKWPLPYRECPSCCSEMTSLSMIVRAGHNIYLQRDCGVPSKMSRGNEGVCHSTQPDGSSDSL